MAKKNYNILSFTQAGVIPINTVLLNTDPISSEYLSLGIQVSSLGTAGVITPEWSNDNINWVNTAVATITGSAVTAINTAGFYIVDVVGVYFRLRLTTATTGGTTTVSTVMNRKLSMQPWNVTYAVVSNTAIDAPFPSPVAIGVRAANANPTAMSANGDLVGKLATMIGAQVVKPYAIPEATWNANLSLTTTTAQALAAAAGAGIKRHITALQAINTGTALDLIILDGATERWRLTLPQNVPVIVPFPTELLTTANTALNINLSAAGTVRVSAQGYTAP